MSDRAGQTPADVLLVEDDPADVLMIQEAFDQHTIRSPCMWLPTVNKLSSSFVMRGGFSDVPRPGLVLLDLNLPRRNGLEVLAEIRADAELAAIPVVMLTTSRAPQDILRSYQLHASAYVTKPTDYDEFIAAAAGIDGFYLGLARLPGAPANS